MLVSSQADTNLDEPCMLTILGFENCANMDSSWIGAHSQMFPRKLPYKAAQHCDCSPSDRILASGPGALPGMQLAH